MHARERSRMQKNGFPEAPAGESQVPWNADDGLRAIHSCATHAEKSPLGRVDARWDTQKYRSGERNQIASPGCQS